MKANHRLYKSYLLRIWRENTNDEWRASLQNIATGECLNFASLAELFGYLRLQSGLSPVSIQNTVIDSPSDLP